MDKLKPTAEETELLTKLRGVIDPELMVNIVDLGLIYDLRIGPDNVEADVTLTSPGCPLGEVITEDIRAVIGNVYPEREVDVSIVWEPAWSTEMITDAGREALNKFGH
jgi:metal-sulfur cluster biosynthetic enzyme